MKQYKTPQMTLLNMDSMQDVFTTSGSESSLRKIHVDTGVLQDEVNWDD